MGTSYDQRTQWPRRFDPRREGAIQIESGVDLPGVKFAGADLRLADLRNANLAGSSVQSYTLKEGEKPDW